jgi:hypothetical protein
MTAAPQGAHGGPTEARRLRIHRSGDGGEPDTARAMLI